MQADPAERIAQGVSIIATVLLTVSVISWRPHLAPTRPPVSAPAEVELTIEAAPTLPELAPPEPPQPAAPSPEPSPPAASSPPEPVPPPPEPPPPEIPPPEPSPPEPPPILASIPPPAARMLSPLSKVLSPRVLRPTLRPPLPQTQPTSPPTPAPLSTVAPPAASVGSASADSSYTSSIRAIIDRRNVPPATAEYQLLHPHGTAEVGYMISRNGTVSGVRLAHSSGSAILDRQALANVASGGYPAMPEAAFAGQAQRSFTIRITFNPSGDYDP